MPRPSRRLSKSSISHWTNEQFKGAEMCWLQGFNWLWDMPTGILPGHFSFENGINIPCIYIPMAIVSRGIIILVWGAIYPSDTELNLTSA